SLVWVDEILLVDGGSTDRTLELCRKPSAVWAGKLKIIERPWSGFNQQRNFAIQAAENDWVFVVDSDEECTPELALRIREILNTKEGPERRAFKVRRIEYFLGREIQHGIWNPSYQDRLFHRAGVKYVNEIHEYPVFANPPGIIHEALRHAPDFGPEKFLDKMNRYTTVEAWDRVKRGQRTHLGHLIFVFTALSLKNYFYYGAYKDGIHGLIISLLEGVSRVVRHVKIWQFGRELDARDRTH
ncbi:MAG: glycosyltransferase family 2 protein, partial [Bdellovibrionota bacterium]